MELIVSGVRYELDTLLLLSSCNWKEVNYAYNVLAGLWNY